MAIKTLQTSSEHVKSTIRTTYARRPTIKSLERHSMSHLPTEVLNQFVAVSISKTEISPATYFEEHSTGILKCWRVSLAVITSEKQGALNQYFTCVFLISSYFYRDT
jgi:hypothetical protein